MKTKARTIAYGKRVWQRARTLADISANTGRTEIPSGWTRSLECFMMLSPSLLAFLRGCCIVHRQPVTGHCEAYLLGRSNLFLLIRRLLQSLRSFAMTTLRQP